MGVEEVLTWLDDELEAQGKFVLGLTAIVCAVIFRKKGILKTEDSRALSKLIFNLFFPCLLFAAVWKADLSFSLWRMAVVSAVVNLVQGGLVHAYSRRLSKERGFRGQWAFSMIGNNIGFTYPLLLAAKGISPGVFPAVVIWDLAGNAPTLFVVNYVTAVLCAPGELQPSTSTVDIGAPTISKDLAADTVGAASFDIAGAATPSTACSTQAMTANTAADSECGENVITATEAQAAVPQFNCCDIVWRVATNLPLVGNVLGLMINLSGVQIPRSIDSIVESMGQPFSVMFFVLIGLNLVWSTVRPQLYRVSKIVACRLALAGFTGAIICLSGVLPTDEQRQAVLLALACPVGGITMGYAIEFGYDNSLQAALVATSNIVSFGILWALVALV